MKSNFTSAYTRFEDLAKSSDFLQFLINNISTAILMLNKHLELQAFNEGFKNIFMNKKDEHLLYIKCGEAIGCAYQVEEKKQCGKTSRCKSCNLRVHALEVYTNRKPIFKKTLIREFYKADGSKENKELSYSIKPFYFKGDYYLMVLVEQSKSWPVILNKSIEIPTESFYS